ncbi:6896_t:CDS:2, partial [Gigaspora margarita]
MLRKRVYMPTYSIPEVLEQILYFLLIDKFLYPALCVSRLWYRCGAPILWKRVELKNNKKFKIIAGLLPNIVHLDFAFSERFGDKILNQIAKSYPYLKYLNLAGYSDGLITNKGLYAIINSCYKLEYLNISHCKEFSEIVIWNVIHSCPKLQEFDIRECKISYTTIKEIELYLKIKYINPDIASRYLKRIGQ